MRRMNFCSIKDFGLRYRYTTQLFSDGCVSWLFSPTTSFLKRQSLNFFHPRNAHHSALDSHKQHRTNHSINTNSAVCRPHPGRWEQSDGRAPAGLDGWSHCHREDAWKLATCPAFSRTGRAEIPFSKTWVSVLVTLGKLTHLVMNLSFLT